MARIGSMPCPMPGCGCPDATVKETGAGAYGVDCHRCGFGGFGKKGTRARRFIEAAMTRDADDEHQAGDPPPPAPSVPPAPAPAPRTLLG